MLLHERFVFLPEPFELLRKRILSIPEPFAPFPARFPPLPTFHLFYNSSSPRMEAARRANSPA